MSETVLITGTSSGIGKASAKLFQERGWNVVATMRDPGKESELTKLDNVLVTPLDVTDPESIRDAVSAASERFGKIDVLVNNAGFGVYGPLEASSLETIRRQFDTNVIGLLETTKAVLPGFRARRNGLVINVSSIGGKLTFPLGSLYHGTKFAVEGISEALSYELAAIGVKLKIVEPGGVKTDFGGRSFTFSNDESMTEYSEIVAKVQKGFASFWEQAEDATGVAGVIYEAATDGTDQLRYISGKDAHAILAKRSAEDDAAYLSEIKNHLSLK